MDQKYRPTHHGAHTKKNYPIKRFLEWESVIIVPLTTKEACNNWRDVVSISIVKAIKPNAIVTISGLYEWFIYEWLLKTPYYLFNYFYWQFRTIWIFGSDSGEQKHTAINQLYLKQMWPRPVNKLNKSLTMSEILTYRGHIYIYYTLLQRRRHSSFNIIQQNSFQTLWMFHSHCCNGTEAKGMCFKALHWLFWSPRTSVAKATGRSGTFSINLATDSLPHCWLLLSREYFLIIK